MRACCLPLGNGLERMLVAGPMELHLCTKYISCKSNWSTHWSSRGIPYCHSFGNLAVFVIVFGLNFSWSVCRMFNSLFSFSSWMLPTTLSAFLIAVLLKFFEKISSMCWIAPSSNSNGKRWIWIWFSSAVEWCAVGAGSVIGKVTAAGVEGGVELGASSCFASVRIKPSKTTRLGSWFNWYFSYLVLLEKFLKACIVMLSLNFLMLFAKLP